MAEKLDRKETASWEEIAYSNMLQIEVLTRLLIKKGIITKDEYEEEYSQMAKELKKKSG